MQDIKAYSLADLKTLAAEKNVKGRSAMNKADLYAALSALETAAAKDLETVQESVQESVQEYYGYDCETVGLYEFPTVRDALNVLGWKRVPRKLKKLWRAYGIVAAA